MAAAEGRPAEAGSPVDEHADRVVAADEAVVGAALVDGVCGVVGRHAVDRKRSVVGEDPHLERKHGLRAAEYLLLAHAGLDAADGERDRVDRHGRGWHERDADQVERVCLAAGALRELRPARPWASRSPGS